MKNGAEIQAREKFHSYITRKYCWIQNDNLCDKLDRISCTKKVISYYKQYELEDEFRRFPLKIYDSSYDLHCNFQSAIENKLQMMYIPNLARNKLYRSHIEKYYENRIYLDFWKLTRRIKSCFRGGSSLSKQVSLFELIKKDKDFKKNRMLKSNVLKETNKKRKNWREIEKGKFGKHRRRKNKFDLNLNLDFLDGKMDPMDQGNITGLINNISRLVSKSNIELEMLNNDDFINFSFMKVGGKAKETHPENHFFKKIGRDYSGSSEKENLSLSNIQSKQVKLKTDRPFQSSKRKFANGRKYGRSSLIKKSAKKTLVITKGQNFSQKYSKLREQNDDNRSINSSFLSPERRKESRKIVFYDSRKNNPKSRAGSKSSRRLQNSNLFMMNTFRSNDRNSKSSRQKKKFKQSKRQEKRNMSIPFNIISSTKKGLPSKTDEKRPKRRIISKIPGTMECNIKVEKNEKSLLFSEESNPENFFLGDGILNKDKILITPEKCENVNMKKSKQKEQIDKREDINFEKSQNLQIKFNGSELSQKFISDVITQEIIKNEKSSLKKNNLNSKKPKNSFIDNLCSFENGKVNVDSKFDNKILNKENETISYNLSGSLKSKQFEFSGKVRFLKSKSLKGIKEFQSKNQILVNNVLELLVKKINKKMNQLDILDLLDEMDIYDKWRVVLKKKEFIKLYMREIKSKKKQASIISKMIRKYAHQIKNKKPNSTQKSKTPFILKSKKSSKKSEKLVNRASFSKEIPNKPHKNPLNTSKKKDDTITTKDILTCQSTKMLNKDIKDSYMFNNSYKTGQKKNKKKLQTRTSHYHKEIIYSSVLNYSDMSRTNLSNHLKKDMEISKNKLTNDTFSRTNQTKRKKKGSLQNKENQILKRKKRPPMRCVASAMKLTRDQVFTNSKISQKKRKSTLNKLYGLESKSKITSPHLKNLYQDPSETDRVIKKNLNLKNLEMESHKSLISNFWNEKLTKRQNSIQQNKLKKQLKKTETDFEFKNSTKIKWDRKTVKSLRDKGLEMKQSEKTGESLLSSKQETSLMKGSMRRVSITGLNLIKTKSPTQGFSKKKSLKLRKIKNKDKSRIKVNKSIKMNLKGNFRKMKSISPPSNWSLSRFNKMKNTFFKKKKNEENPKNEILNMETKKANTLLSGHKRKTIEKESPQEIGSSANFFCNNPYTGINEKNRISRVLAREIKEAGETKPFFKKTLPEISEGETNESSEHTIVISAKKESAEGKKEKNVKLQKFSSGKRIKKDLIQRKSMHTTPMTPLNQNSSCQKIKKKSPLGKRLAKQSRPRQIARSTKEIQPKEACTSEEISTSSRNHNLRRNFEELSKQMKKNSDHFYLGNPRLLERNEDTRFKILNAKKSVKRKSKVDGSRLTDNGRETLESEVINSEALKTSPNNFIKSKKRSTVLGKTFNVFRKENRSLDARKKRKGKFFKMQTPDNSGNNKKKVVDNIKTGILVNKDQNKSADKGKFYLPRNLKVFKSSKIGLMNFEKHKLTRQKTINGRSEIKKVPFLNKKKRNKFNGSQDSFKTQDILQKRFKNGKNQKLKTNGLVIIKKKFEKKGAMLKARSFDKSRLVKDNALGTFTFGK